MGNLKHTIAALAAVSLVSTLAAVQMMNLDSVRADKLAQKIETVDELPVLVGDGEGETVDFNVPSSSPLKQNYAGQDAYILTSGGSINLRAAADTESTILDVLQVGTKVSILDVDDGWFKVKSGEFTYSRTPRVLKAYGSEYTIPVRTVEFDEKLIINDVLQMYKKMII